MPQASYERGVPVGAELEVEVELELKLFGELAVRLTAAACGRPLCRPGTGVSAVCNL